MFLELANLWEVERLGDNTKNEEGVVFNETNSEIIGCVDEINIWKDKDTQGWEVVEEDGPAEDGPAEEGQVAAEQMADDTPQLTPFPTRCEQNKLGEVSSKQYKPRTYYSRCTAETNRCRCWNTTQALLSMMGFALTTRQACLSSLRYIDPDWNIFTALQKRGDLIRRVIGNFVM